MLEGSSLGSSCTDRFQCWPPLRRLKMETWDAITARRNVPEFSGRAIEDADLDRVLEAGRIAPSSQNNQPWDFVVVTEREMLRDLSTVWRGGGHIGNAAAAIAMVIPDEPEPRARERNRFDIGQATMQMMIAAADRGIGSGHSAVGDPDLARAVPDVPAGKLVAFVMDLGYPADRPLKPGTRLKRRPVDEVVHRNGWGGATPVRADRRG